MTIMKWGFEMDKWWYPKQYVVKGADRFDRPIEYWFENICEALDRLSEERELGSEVYLWDMENESDEPMI